MCELTIVLAFVVAHFAAWRVLGGGWRGAARAPFVVFLPAVALLLLDAVFFDRYDSLPLKVGTLISWQLMYFFVLVCLRIATRPAPADAR